MFCFVTVVNHESHRYFSVLVSEFACPALGYMQFLHQDWLKQILSWQHEDGCFGEETLAEDTDDPKEEIFAQRHLLREQELSGTLSAI